jgi:hypothetical protein
MSMPNQNFNNIEHPQVIIFLCFRDSNTNIDMVRDWTWIWIWMWRGQGHGPGHSTQAQAQKRTDMDRD